MWRRRKPRDLKAEIDAHLEIEAERFQSEGLSPDEARFAARRAFGNRTHVEERHYESGRWMLLDHFARDLRFAARLLAKDTRFSVLAVLGLALGIGVSTTVFTVIAASLDYNEMQQDPKSYVGLTRVINGRAMGDFSTREYEYFRDHATSFHAVTAESGRDHFLMTRRPGSEAEETQARYLSANSIPIAIGRTFSADEEQIGGAPVAVLNFTSWKQRFAADAAVVGKSLTINARPVTVIGVARDGFFASDLSDFYLPLALRAAMGSTNDHVMLGAVLRPGVSLTQARAEVDVLANALRQIEPPSPREGGVVLTPGGINPDKAKELMALAATAVIAVSMILLIACSNLANLLLARAVVRQREIAVRLSLGATRGRLVAQLLTESLLLALAGGALGLMFSHWLASVLMLLMMNDPSRPLPLHYDPLVPLYAFVISVAAGLSFGLAPALASTRTELARALHAQGLAGWAKPQTRGRKALVIVPLAMSLMLLLGAGVAVRRVQRNYIDGPQFDATHLLGASLRLNIQGYDRGRTLEFQDNLRQRIASMPGVASVALASSMPLANSMGWLPVSMESGPAESSDYNVITPGYFETVGARVVRGRGFTGADREGGPAVAIVNQDFVRRYWPDTEPIGKRIRLARGASGYFDVVGVAPDFQDALNPDSYVRPTIYVPLSQAAEFFKGIRMDTPPYQTMVLARTSGDPAVVKAAIRQEVHAVNSTLRVTVETVEESLNARLGPLKTVSLMLSALGGLALLMASVGIYAILAYAVSQRTREIGIRTALGARRGEIVALVMQRTASLIAWGIGIGLVGAVVLTRVFARKFAKFGELDAVTCLAVSLLLAAVAMVASYLPARKALRVDPVEALRCE